jgi:hypothetical protein
MAKQQPRRIQRRLSGRAGHSLSIGVGRGAKLEVSCANHMTDRALVGSMCDVLSWMFSCCAGPFDDRAIGGAIA